MNIKLLFVLCALVNFQNTFSQVFEDKLIDNQSNQEVIQEKPFLGSPNTTEVDISLNPVQTGIIDGNNVNRRGASIQEISALANAPIKSSTFSSPMGMARRSDLIDNQNRIKQDENNYLALYGFLFIILITTIMIIIIRKSSTNEDPKTILESEKSLIESGKNKKRDMSKILAEIEKLQELKQAGAINDYEYEQLKKDIFSQ